MSIPETIPVKWEEGYRTDKIGTFDKGQYMGFEFYLEPNQLRLISVLHLFDLQGFHIESRAWDSKEGYSVQEKLDSAISQLSGATPGDVEVRPFSVTLFGKKFGLIEHKPDRVVYEPYGLAFFPPWDGYYDT